jgi:hypothetical protein
MLNMPGNNALWMVESPVPYRSEWELRNGACAGLQEKCGPKATASAAMFPPLCFHNPAAAVPQSTAIFASVGGTKSAFPHSAADHRSSADLREKTQTKE